jgi:hypothetical protein
MTQTPEPTVVQDPITAAVAPGYAFVARGMFKSGRR